MFEKQEADVEFDPGMFAAMVEKVVVDQKNGDGRIELEFKLLSGQLQRIEI